MIPHQPPAKTLVFQKFAPTLPSSVSISTMKAKTSMIPKTITKHLGHSFTKELGSGDDMS